MTYDEIISGLLDIKHTLFLDPNSREYCLIEELPDNVQYYIHCISAAVNTINSISIPKYIRFLALVNCGYSFEEAGKQLDLCKRTITLFSNRYKRGVGKRGRLLPENPFVTEVHNG